MFDSKEIEAYRAISAPADLRQKVLSSCTEEMKPARNFSRMIRTVSTLAACLVLVTCFSVMALGNFFEADAFISGEMITEEATVFAEEEAMPLSLDARTLSHVDVPMTLEMRGKTEITVSDGVLLILDDTTDEVLETVSSGTAYKTDKTTALIWTISADAEQKSFEMTIKSLFNTEVITLTYEETLGEWLIFKTK